MSNDSVVHQEPEDPHIPSGRRPPLPPRFRWFFTAQTVSVLGSAMTPVSLAFAVLEVSDSATYLSIVLAAQMIPLIALIILGGGVADRYRRDLVLRITNTGAGLTQAAVAATVLTHQHPGWLIPLAALNGTFQAFTSPAMRGIVPQLVPPNDVQRANGLLSSIRNAARLAGPSAAGVLVASVGGGWGIAMDAASFLIAAACLTQVRLPDRVTSTTGTLLRDLREGWTYFRSVPWLWSNTAAFTLLNAVQMGVWQVLGPVIARDTIGARGWGLVLSCQAAGLLLASLGMTRLTVRRPLLYGLPAMTALAIPLVLLGTRAPTPYLAAAAFVAGLASSFFGILWDTVRQTAIPAPLLSRAIAYDDFGAFAAIPVGQLSAAPLAAALGLSTVAVGGAGLLVAAMLAPLLLPSVRQLTLPGPSDQAPSDRAPSDQAPSDRAPAED